MLKKQTNIKDQYLIPERKYQENWSYNTRNEHVEQTAGGKKKQYDP